jgi:hypothetical protein
VNPPEGGFFIACIHGQEAQMAEEATPHRAPVVEVISAVVTIVLTILGTLPTQDRRSRSDHPHVHLGKSGVEGKAFSR